MTYRFVILLLAMFLMSSCAANQSEQLSNIGEDNENSMFGNENCESDQMNRLVLLSFMIIPQNKRFGLNLNPANLSEDASGSFMVNGKEHFYNHEGDQIKFSDPDGNKSNYTLLGISEVHETKTSVTNEQMLCRGVITINDIKNSEVKKKKKYLMDYTIMTSDRNNPQVEFTVINVN